MSYSLSPWLKPRFFITGTNRPLAGGLMYTYLAGTTTNATTYSDDAGTPNTNPIVLNSDGECDLYLDDSVSYRIILKNAAGVTQFDKDNVTAIGGTVVQSIPTIADLRLKVGSARTNSAQTLGYWSVGDGGGNSFCYSTTSTATDNGGTVIKPTAVSGAGRWLAVNVYDVNVRQFGAKGDGSFDDTTFVQAAINSTLGSVIFGAGVYVCTTLTISKKVMFLGMRGTNAGANVLPRIFLKNGTNANLINITTTGVLYADKIDFWGNKAGQTPLSAANCINLEEDATLEYIGANALSLNDCIVRNSAGSGIYCRKNRNGGLLLNTILIDNDNAGFVLFGSDWYSNFSGFGSSGGANLYTDFGASNDFVLCDFYYSGKNADYGSSKSNVYIGSSVNCITIANCQINSGYHHGIECASTIAAGHYTFTGNQFGANGLAAVNTYSNIQIGAAKAAIKGNVHWYFGQKPKYLIETTGSAVRVDFDDVYVAASYVTAVTNDETKLFNRSDVNGTTLGDGGYFQSRKSANDRFFKSFIGTEVNERFSIDGTGICRWGAGGGTATDTALLRTVANCLELASDDCFKTGKNTTANRPSAFAVGVGSQFYDTTLSKPIWSDGAVWRDAAGTAV